MVLPGLMALVMAGTAEAMASEARRDSVPHPAGRLAPPASVHCHRDDLTSDSGTVSAFERGTDSTRIEITTDCGSVETFILPHLQGNVADHFLLWGRPFGLEVWPEIETAPGRLRNGLQAIVWVCADAGVAPLVDWRPDSPAGRQRPHGAKKG